MRLDGIPYLFCLGLTFWICARYLPTGLSIPDVVVPCVQVHVGLAWCLRQFQCYGRSLGLAAPAGLSVFLGTGEAAGLAGYSRVAAVFAKAQQFGLSASFLLTESAVLHALRGLVSLPVVLESFLPPGLDLGWVWLSAVPRLSGCAGGRAFLWWLSGRPVLAFRGAAACHPPTRSAIQHEVMLEGYSFRILWGAFGSTSGLDSMYFSRGRLPRS